MPQSVVNNVKTRSFQSEGGLNGVEMLKRGDVCQVSSQLTKESAREVMHWIPSR